MGRKILDNIEPIKDCDGFLDCLYTVLSATGMFNKPLYMLSGMTGLCFRFVAHRRLIPPSIGMYDRPIEHREAIDRLGVCSEPQWGRINNCTFPLYQARLVKAIRESIDADMYVIGWLPLHEKHSDFGVVTGYDDDDEVIFYRDRWSRTTHILLYRNIGLVNSASWYFHIIGNKADKDVIDIYKDSLEKAVDEWEIPYKLPYTTNYEFASGKNAYDFMIKALECGDFDEYGASDIMNIYINFKQQIYEYFQEMTRELPRVQPILEEYSRLKEVAGEMCRYVKRVWGNNKIDRNDIPEIIYCFKKGREIEESAIEKIKTFLREPLNNRFIDMYDIKKF